MPLFRRVPKRGFKNIFAADEIAIVNVQALTRYAAGSVVTPELLYSEGLVKDAGARIKLLGKGELDRALTVQVHQVSKGATAKVEAAGGKVEVI
jgi:large subunit ribosomal protein L15